MYQLVIFDGTELKMRAMNLIDIHHLVLQVY